MLELWYIQDTKGQLFADILFVIYTIVIIIIIVGVIITPCGTHYFDLAQSYVLSIGDL